jgi:hypothetical protein
MFNYVTIQKLMSSFSLGLFYNLSASDDRLPNGLARVLDVDDEGYGWFLFHFPGKELGDLENEFPARFRLYEKGRDCYVEVSGKAIHLKDQSDWSKCTKISYGLAKALQYHGLILRLKIEKAVVYELSRSSRRNAFQKVLDQLDEWITGRSITETVYQSAAISAH